tara:strand:+ start:993 stop:1112 length:120 start_codon:yes stop_codon:yes gene_type:complete
MLDSTTNVSKHKFQNHLRGREIKYGITDESIEIGWGSIY